MEEVLSIIYLLVTNELITNGELKKDSTKKRKNNENNSVVSEGRRMYIPRRSSSTYVLYLCFSIIASEKNNG